MNQQSHVVQDIVRSSKNHPFGLEVGSKPELLIALSLISNKKSLIICNGFKDKPYIEMALMFQKSGRNVFIVIERMKELSMVLETAKKLKVKPQIGFRLKLHTQSTGKWLSSSGSKSKFGLTTAEIVQSTQILKQFNAEDSLKLLHFHIGSQITSIHPIKSAIKESARLLCELNRMGFNIQYMDVGGGLGVDYDGSGKATAPLTTRLRNMPMILSFTCKMFAMKIIFLILTLLQNLDVFSLPIALCSFLTLLTLILLNPNTQIFQPLQKKIILLFGTSLIFMKTYTVHL